MIVLILLCICTNGNTLKIFLTERFYYFAFLCRQALNIRTADIFIYFNVFETFPVSMTLPQRLHPGTYCKIMAQMMHHSDGLC